MAVITRPDVAFTVLRLARFLINPGPLYHKITNKVINYLVSIKDLALFLTVGVSLQRSHSLKITLKLCLQVGHVLSSIELDRTIFCMRGCSIHDLPHISTEHLGSLGTQELDSPRENKFRQNVRCVTSDKGPSTTWLSTWLSTCRDSNPDPWKRGKWVAIKSRASESRGYKESRTTVLTHTHTQQKRDRI